MFRLLVPLAGAVTIAAIAQPALANPLFDLGAASNFTVLGQNDTLEPGALTVGGNVGVEGGGKLTIGGTGVVVSGNADYYNPITSSNFVLSPPGTLSIDGKNCSSLSTCKGNGSVVQNQTLVGNATTALGTLYDSVVNLTGTSSGVTNFKTVSSLAHFSLTMGSNVNYVVDVSGSSTLNSAFNSVNITGNATDYVVFNILNGAGFTGSSGGAINLNGISADHVLFNFACTGTGNNCNDTETGSDISLSGSFQGAGVMLAMDRDITDFATSSIGWTGRFFSGTDETIHLFSGATVRSAIPEPASLAIFAGALGILGLLLWPGARLRKPRQA